MNENRFRREQETLAHMVKIYCRLTHKQKECLCEECETLLRYAEQRLQNCPFKEKKPTCKNCTIHCYKPDAAKKVREIMRLAGPRMLYYHPILAVLHLWNARK